MYNKNDFESVDSFEPKNNNTDNLNTKKNNKNNSTNRSDNPTEPRLKAAIVQNMELIQSNKQKNLRINSLIKIIQEKNQNICELMEVKTNLETECIRLNKELEDLKVDKETVDVQYNTLVLETSRSSSRKTVSVDSAIKGKW